MCISTQEHDSMRALEEESEETKAIAEKLQNFLREQKKHVGSLNHLFELLPKPDASERQ